MSALLHKLNKRLKPGFFYILLPLLLSTQLVSQYSNGTYCADVDRYNPKTYKESSYRLTVAVSNNHLVQMNWPNGGHSDTDDFPATEIESSKAVFSDYHGVQFRVTILNKGTDCFGDVPKATRCTGRTKAGNRCKNMTDNRNGRCWRH